MSILSMTLLPLPDGPRMVTVSPRRTAKSSPV